jgi:uncharacterized membrane protein YgcG
MRPVGGTLTETFMRRSMLARRSAVLLSLSTLFAPVAGAQQSSERPAPRPLGAAVATSEAMRAISAVRQLPGGRLLVNDPASRRVVMLDSMMKIIKVVADTTPATQNAYGLRGGGILPWRGDSTLFLDPASLSMLVLDPDGEIKRVMAAPRPDDVFSLVGGALGYPGFDAKGRLVYRATGLTFPRRPGGGQGGAAGFQPPTLPDTTPLVRFDLATRKLDTVAYIKVAAPRIAFLENEGRRQLSLTVNPLPEVDDWAMLPDGTVAILRKDYHVDFVDADGKRTAGPKIPFDWQRLTDSAKTAIVDSVKALVERGGPAAGLQGLLGGGDGGGMGAGAFGGGGFGGFGGGGGGFGGGGRGNRGGGGGADGPPPPRRDAASGGAAAGAGGTAVPGAAGGARQGGGAGGRGFGPQVNIVPSNELPDYRPAFANGSVRADADGKLWVRVIPTKPTGRGPEYDVIDRTGKLVDRVMLPAGTTIAGFGPGGMVYLGVRDAAGVHVVRAHER